MRFVLPSPYRSQSPLVRILGSVVTLIALAALAVFGVLALAILAVGGFVWYLWFRWRLYRLRKQAASRDRTSGRATGNHSADAHSEVIEGEYVVINEHRDSVP